MASFTQRGKTWQYTVSRMVNGVSDPIRKGGFKTKKEAQVAAAEVEAGLSKGIVPVFRKVPFDSYFEDWVKIYRPHVNKNTRARYNDTLKIIQELFPGENLKNITKRDYQAAINKLGEKLAKSTCQKMNSHIRACVREAVDEGIIRVDFTRGVTITGRAAKREEEKHLNYFESKRLTKFILQKPKIPLSHYLILLGLTSGMRFAELVGLTRDDFLFKTNEIDINKTWGYTNKMHKGFGPTKNEQSVRKIKMDSKTMQIFKDLFDRTPSKNKHNLVFYSPDSKYKVISNNAINKALKSILEELNFQEISSHGLRHTHASILLYKRASIYYVSERLGHSSIETTNEYYAHILKELREEDDVISTATFDDLVG